MGIFQNMLHLSKREIPKMERYEKLEILKQLEVITNEIIEISHKEISLSKQCELDLEDQVLIESMQKVITDKNKLVKEQRKLHDKLLNS